MKMRRRLGCAMHQFAGQCSSPAPEDRRTTMARNMTDDEVVEFRETFPRTSVGKIQKHLF